MTSTLITRLRATILGLFLGLIALPAPALADDPPPTSQLSAVVLQSAFTKPDDHLAHNIPDLRLTIDGDRVTCGFLTHYQATGDLIRWGYATSEVLEERPGALTQYYQRGVVDCHQRNGAWLLERRLAWDYLGGGIAGSVDLGVEPHLLSEQPGLELGPWGHRVSNFAIDGTTTGFLDFFVMPLVAFSHSATRRLTPAPTTIPAPLSAYLVPLPASSANTSKPPSSNTIPAALSRSSSALLVTTS